MPPAFAAPRLLLIHRVVLFASYDTSRFCLHAARLRFWFTWTHARLHVGCLPAQRAVLVTLPHISSAFLRGCGRALPRFAHHASTLLCCNATYAYWFAVPPRGAFALPRRPFACYSAALPRVCRAHCLRAAVAATCTATTATPALTYARLLPQLRTAFHTDTFTSRFTRFTAPFAHGGCRCLDGRIHHCATATRSRGLVVARGGSLTLPTPRHTGLLATRRVLAPCRRACNTCRRLPVIHPLRCILVGLDAVRNTVLRTLRHVHAYYTPFTPFWRLRRTRLVCLPHYAVHTAHTTIPTLPLHVFYPPPFYHRTHTAFHAFCRPARHATHAVARCVCYPTISPTPPPTTTFARARLPHTG